MSIYAWYAWILIRALAFGRACSLTHFPFALHISICLCVCFSFGFFNHSRTCFRCHRRHLTSFQCAFVWATFASKCHTHNFVTVVAAVCCCWRAKRLSATFDIKYEECASHATIFYICANAWTQLAVISDGRYDSASVCLLFYWIADLYIN